MNEQDNKWVVAGVGILIWFAMLFALLGAIYYPRGPVHHDSCVTTLRGDGHGGVDMVEKICGTTENDLRMKLEITK